MCLNHVLKFLHSEFITLVLWCIDHLKSHLEKNIYTQIIILLKIYQMRQFWIPFDRWTGWKLSKVCYFSISNRNHHSSTENLNQQTGHVSKVCRKLLWTRFNRVPSQSLSHSKISFPGIIWPETCKLGYVIQRWMKVNEVILFSNL